MVFYKSNIFFNKKLKFSSQISMNELSLYQLFAKFDSFVLQ